MKHYVVNRKSRLDRLLLWQGAMTSQRVPRADFCIRVAMDKDDFPTRKSLCEAAIADGFTGFFGYHVENSIDYIGYGILLGSWSMMRVWREIAQGNETAVAWVDDYALGEHERELRRLVSEIEPDVLQLCWHYRNDLYPPKGMQSRSPYHVWPYPPEPKTGRKDVVVGAAGSADWALVLSPIGAQWLLDYMEKMPYFNTESVVAPMWYENHHRKSVYSVTANNPQINGMSEMSGNRWVVGLGQFTDTASDLVGLHEVPDVVKPKEETDG